LEERWRAARNGGGGLVLIAGEPGIGKTRLVEEFAAPIVRPGSAVVLVGGCHDGDVVANAPFVEAITRWVRGTTPAVAGEVLGAEGPVVARMAPAIAEVLPEIGEPLPTLPGAETARLHDAVGQVLLRLAGSAPVLLVIEDLHWADDATVGLLRAVSRTARRGALLVIGTYRETDVDRLHPFAQALGILQRETEPARVGLDGLGVADVHTMLERIAEQDVPGEFAAMLAAETDGNPFFVRETLLHLWEEGELRFDAGAWTLTRPISDVGVPAGIRDVIGRRLSRLPDATNRLLAVGALFEVAFPLGVVADVAGLDEDAALDAIDAALQARIVAAADTFDEYAFTHALFRHALVDELNPSRQVRMHRSIATALEKRLWGEPTPALAAALARHYQRSAALPDAGRGVPYALAAADDAARRYARSEEYDALGIALELSPDDDERRGELLRRRAEAAVLARLGADPVVAAVAAAGEAIAATDGDDAACDFVAARADEASRMDDLRVAWKTAAVGRKWMRPDRRAVSCVRLRALELAERDFDDPTNPGLPLDTPERRELHDLAAELHMAVVEFGQPSYGSRAEAQRAYDAEMASGSSRDATLPLFVLGDHRALCTGMRPLVDDARALGIIPLEVLGLAILARSLNVLGDYDDADACLDDAKALLPRINERSNAAYQLLSADFLVQRARGARIPVDTAADYEKFRDSPDVRWAWMTTTAATASIHAEVGNTADAMALLENIFSVIDQAAGWAPNYLLLIDFVVHTLWLLQRREHVDLIERNLRTKVLEPDVRYLETDARWMLALLCALDGRIDEARHWFDEARRVLDEQDSKSMLIAVDYDEATMNVRLGGPDQLTRARALLERARARCTHPAVAPWLARIDEIATRC
jgi:tetratricopeptide (TPR) repeat protein